MALFSGVVVVVVVATAVVVLPSAVECGTLQAWDSQSDTPESRAQFHLDDRKGFVVTVLQSSWYYFLLFTALDHHLSMAVSRNVICIRKKTSVHSIFFIENSNNFL